MSLAAGIRGGPLVRVTGRWRVHAPWHHRQAHASRARWSFAMLAVVGVSLGAAVARGVQGRGHATVLPPLTVEKARPARVLTTAPTPGALVVDEGPAIPATLRAHPAARGQLSVYTDPPAATVELDGTALPATTPLSLWSVDADETHELMVRRAGFEPAHARFVVAPHQTFAVEIRLAGAPLSDIPVVRTPIGSSAPVADEAEDGRHHHHHQHHEHHHHHHG